MLRRQSETLECVEDGRLLAISYDQLKQLFVQNPQFGFFLLRLTTTRVLSSLTMFLNAQAA